MNKNYFQAGECKCGNCRGACRSKPGWFHPDQIAPLAAMLGMTEKDLFDQHLSVDWWDDPNGDTFVLSPRLSSESGGAMFPGNPEGRCHWLTEDGLCAIHDTGFKPAECQALTCQSSYDQSHDNHRAMRDAWNTRENQRRIRDLLGEEPVANEYFPCSLLPF